MQSHLFGDLFARDALDYQGLKIATVSALASLDGVDSQLKAHMRIATNVGLEKDQLAALLSVLKRSVGEQEANTA